MKTIERQLLQHILDCIDGQDQEELANAVSDARNVLAGKSFAARSAVLRTNTRSFFGENQVLRSQAGAAIAAKEIADQAKTEAETVLAEKEETIGTIIAEGQAKENKKGNIVAAGDVLVSTINALVQGPLLDPETKQLLTSAIQGWTVARAQNQ